MKFLTLGATIGSALAFSACSSTTAPLITATAEKPDTSLIKDAPINQSSSLSLTSIAHRVKKNNPQLRAARLRINEARGQVVQSGRLSNPDLELSLNKNVRSSEGGLEVGFAQRFPVTNRLHLEKRISRQQLSIAKEEVKIAQQSLTTQAQLIAVEILHNRRRVKSLQKQQSLLDKFASFIHDAAQRGELSSLEANQAKVESATLSSEIQRIKGNERIALNKLKSYIGLSPNRPLNLTGSLSSAQLPSSSLSLRNRAEYRAKLLEIEQAQQHIALQKANRYEDIEGRFFASVDREEDAPEGLETEGTIGAGISIPLQFFNKNEGNIQSSRARATRLHAEKAALVLELKQQAANERAEMSNWLAQNKELRSNLIPLANTNAEQLDSAYRNGQAPFTSVLKARSQQLDFQSKNIDNLEAFHKARVRYFAAIGSEQSAF